MPFDGIYRVLAIIDGDGFIASHFISNELVEIRLIGIDAPESKKCPKLLRDEKELHIPGHLLMHLGRVAASFLASVIPVGTLVNLQQEEGKTVDKYGRFLAYAGNEIFPDVGSILVMEGFAKPYPEFYCNSLSEYQLLNTFARQNRKGLYGIVDRF